MADLNNNNDYDSENLNNIDEDIITRQNDLKNLNNNNNNLQKNNSNVQSKTQNSSNYSSFFDKYKELLVVLILFMIFASPQLCSLVCSLISMVGVKSDSWKCVLNLSLRSVLFVLVYYFVDQELNKHKN